MVCVEVSSVASLRCSPSSIPASAQPKIGLKGDIGMANYEKQVEQEAAYPIPISLQDSEA